MDVGDQDEKFADELAKQQACRPKYTRVISWEFSRDTQEDPSEKRRKQRSYERKMRKRKRSDEEVKKQEAMKNIEYSSTEGSGDEVDSETMAQIDEGAMAEVFEDFDDLSVKNLGKTTPGKKAQERLSRELFECAMSDLLTLDESFDPDIIDSHKPVPEFVVSNKPVPSLVDLCLRVDWKVTDRECEVTIADIPPGLRNIVRTKQQMCRTNAAYLKCFHRTLACRERYPDDYLEQNCPEDSSEKQKKNIRVIRRTFRAVFEYTASNYGFKNIDIVCGSPVEQTGYINHDGAFEDLVQTMDLMLPPVVGRNKDAVDKDQIASLKAALRKRYPNLVKYVFDEALPYVWWSRGNYGLAKTAFLNLVEKFKGGPSAKRAAAYVNEIGRLYLYQNEPDLAITYFKEAPNDLPSMNRESTDAIPVHTLLLCANAYDQGILDSTRAEKSSSFWNSAAKCYGSPLSIMRYAVEMLLSVHLSTYNGQTEKLKNVRKNIEEFAAKNPSLNYHLSCMNVILDDEMLANLSLKDIEISSSFWNIIFEQKNKGLLPTMCTVWRTQLLHPLFYPLDDREMVDGRFMDFWEWFHPFSDFSSYPLGLRLTDDGHLTGGMRMLLPAMRSVLLDPYTGLVSFPEVPLRPESLTNAGTTTGRYIGNTHLPHHFTILEKPDGSRVDYIENSSFWDMGTRAQSIVLRYTTATGNIYEVDILASVKAADYLQLRQLYLTFKKKKKGPKPKRKYKKNKPKPYNEEDHYTYYEREFLRRSEEYKGSEQWKKDCAVMLRKLYQRGKNMLSVQQFVHYEFHKKLKEELDKDPKAKQKYNKHRTDYGQVIDSSVIGSYYFYDPFRSEQSYSVNFNAFKVYGNTIALMMGVTEGEALVIVNCKDKDTFQNPKIYMSSRTMCYDQASMDFHWATQQFDSESDILMIPTSNDSYHPDAKVIGIYEYTYDGKQGNNLYIFDEDGNILRRNTNFTHRYLPSTGRLELCCVIGTRMYGIPLRGDRVFCDHILYSTATEKFPHRLMQLQSFGENLILGTAVGIAFMNKDMKLCKIDAEALVTRCKFIRPTLSEDGYYLRFEGDNTAEYQCTILNRTQALKSGCPLIIAHESHVIVIGKMGEESVSLLQHAELPARAVEAHYISKKVGFVVSFSLKTREDHDYREHVLHISPSGTIQSILPFLAQGPRDFFSVELQENKEVQGQNAHIGKPGWYLYLNDGHGGIQCIYMGDYE